MRRLSMKKYNYMAFACFALIGLVACSEDRVSGTSVEPNTLFNTEPMNEPRNCRVVLSDGSYSDEECQWNAEMWNAESGYRVRTGYDNGTNTSGIWYWKEDTTDGINGRLQWPDSVGDMRDSLALSSVIDKCGGSVCGSVFFDMKHPNPDANAEPLTRKSKILVGFNLGGLNENGNAVAVDATEMKGLCVKYSLGPVEEYPWIHYSDFGILLELDAGDSLNALSNNNLYNVQMQNIETPMDTYEFCYRWDAFKSKYSQVPLDVVLRHLTGIRFALFSTYSNNYFKFDISAIGRYSERQSKEAVMNPVEKTCKPASVEEWFCTCNYSEEDAVLEAKNKASDAFEKKWDSIASVMPRSADRAVSCLLNLHSEYSRWEPKKIDTEKPCSNPLPKTIRCENGSLSESVEALSSQANYQHMVDSVYEKEMLTYPQYSDYQKCFELKDPPVFYYGIDGDLWNGANGVEKVDVGLYADPSWKKMASGEWFYSADEGGKSTIDWIGRLGNEYSEDSFESVVESCGGVCGTAVLEKGDLIYDPFAVVGFTLAKDSSGNSIPVDISNWGGICIAYYSETALALELDLGDSVNVLLGWAWPSVSLPKSTSRISKCFSWSDFKIPSWNKDVPEEWLENPGEKASRHVVAVRFKMQAESGEYGFNITSIRTLRE